MSTTSAPVRLASLRATSPQIVDGTYHARLQMEAAALAYLKDGNTEAALDAVLRLGLALREHKRLVEVRPQVSCAPRRRPAPAQGRYLIERLPRGTYCVSRDGRHLRWTPDDHRELVRLLLTDVLGPEAARDAEWNFAQDFREQLAGHSWRITADEIRAWAARQD